MKRLIAGLLYVVLLPMVAGADSIPPMPPVLGEGPFAPPVEPVDPVEYGPRRVFYKLDFETGKFQPNGSLHDGAFVQTLPHPQLGSLVANTGSGGCGPNSNCDSRVVRTFIVPENGSGGGDEIVKPRAGEYFMRSLLWQTLYKSNAFDNVEKPLSEFPKISYQRKDFRKLADGAVRNSWANQHRMEFDRTFWVGYSFYFPKNWEIETEAPFPTASTRMLVEHGTQASNDMYVMSVRTRSGKAVFEIDYVTGNGTVVYNAGDLEGWQGKWMDVVVRGRANPCGGSNSCSTSVGTMKPNTGIFQVWISDPKDNSPDANGNYAMLKVIDRVNTPIGPVKVNGDMIGHRLKMYAYGWGNQKTSVTGPINVNFDEHSWGYEDEGTSYSDVHPGRAEMPK